MRLRSLVFLGSITIATVPACSVLFSASPATEDGGDGDTVLDDGGTALDDGGISPGANVIQVWSGPAANHSCATKGNQIVCWGNNSVGQLGPTVVGATAIANNANIFYIPNQANAETIVDVALGAAHSCALLDSGKVYCWGANDKGQLGQGNTTPSDMPVLVEVALSANATKAALHISAGVDETCAQMAEQSQGSPRSLRCWGNTIHTAQAFISVPDSGLPTPPWGDNELPSSIPDIPVGFSLQSMGVGLTHICALSRVVPPESTPIEVRCWGELPAGAADVLRDAQTVNNTTESFKTLVAGGQFSCILGDNGAVRCWGDNVLASSVLFTEFVPPGDIAFTDPINKIGVRTLAAGAQHVCALMGDRSLRCWGHGDSGVTGHADSIDLQADANGTTVFTDTDTIESLAAGRAHTCVVQQGGRIRCFGNNFYKQLGVEKPCSDLDQASNSDNQASCNYGDETSETANGSPSFMLFD